MLRLQVRPVVGLLAVLAAVGIAGCGSDSGKSNPVSVTHSGTDLLGGAGKFASATDTGKWFLQAPDGAAVTYGACDGYADKCATVTGTDLGTADYDAQLIHWDAGSDAPKYVTLTKNKLYMLGFAASSSVAGKTIRVSVIDESYVEHASKTVTLTATPTAYFTDSFIPNMAPVSYAADPDHPQVTIRVSVGGVDTSSVKISGIQLFELGSPGAGGGGGGGVAGGGGGGGATGEIDLLAGNGSFDTADQQGYWHLNLKTDGTYPASASTSVNFADCSDLSQGCAVVTSPDYGGRVEDNRWYTQLAYGASGGLDTLTINKNKTYHLTIKGKYSKTQSSTAAKPGTFAVWMQETASGSYKWPPIFQYYGTLTTTADSYDTGPLTIDATNFGSGSTCGVDFVIALGPDSNNNGVTFYLDEIKLLEK